MTNTDRISILGTSASESVAISLATGVFSPGATEEGDGTSEIEFTVDLFGQFEDALIIVGSFGNDTLTTGSAGINLNNDFDPDVTAGGLSYLQVFGLGGNDTISAAGGRGTGEPDTVANLYGDSGWDFLTGGSAGDYLEGGAGKDRLRGKEGSDELVGGGGNDKLEGGRGEDRLLGSPGRDELRGGQGKDRLNGGDGTDSCYPGPNGGKTASCEKGTALLAAVLATQDCQGYSPCIAPGSDVDCAGGSGNGPRYVEGPITVTGSDPYGLDADGDGVGCESGGGGGTGGGGGGGGGGDGGGGGGEGDCTPGYSPCIPPGSDVDCAGGSGNGPRYVEGPVTVTGSDPYGLDADGDGIGCE